MIEMLLKGGAGHQNVVQINEDKGEVMENSVQPINVRRINRNLVVSLHQIKLVKNVGAMEADRNILESGGLGEGSTQE